MKKRRFGSMLTILFLVAIMCTANAIPAPGSCEIIENPTNAYIKCEQSHLTIYQRPEKIEIIESPMTTDSPAFEKLQNEINQKISEGWEAYPIYLEVPGEYIFRVNDSQEVTVLYGSSSNIKGILETATLLASILLLAAGAIILKFTDKKTPAKLLLAIGILLLVIHWQLLAIMV